MKFRDLETGQTFDFVSPNRMFNSFFLRCEKISARKYKDENNHEYRIGTINCEVYHVD